MRLTITIAICVLGAGIAAEAQQKTFDSPDAAAKALISAAEQDDTAALKAIFGPNADSILTSGDPAQDKAEREEFVSIAHQKYQIEPDSMTRNRVILSIGDDDWPFPVPIVKTNGKWSFDTSLGATMMRARRIGADELDAIEVCTGFGAAEVEYAEKHAGIQYALRMVGSPGKDDGLYSEAHPLVPKEFAEAVADGVSNLKPKRYHGYYFKVLTAQGPEAAGGQHTYIVKDSLMGGFALVAWPAQYGVTGVHAFIMNQDGVVYEANLGRPKDPLLAPVKVFDPGPAWKAVN